MRVKHYARGKFYLIDCPPGSRVIRQSDQLDAFGDFLPDLVVVRFKSRAIAIPVEPPALLPLLADAGRFGLALVGTPRPDLFLAGAVCPDCGERDDEWLWRVDDGPVHCERCGACFETGGEPSNTMPPPDANPPDDGV